MKKLLLFISLVGIFPFYGYSQFITISSNKFVVNGSCQIYMNGANNPWENWNDFGGSYNAATWNQDMINLRNSGINAARIWFSCDGNGQPSISINGVASTPTAAFWQNCDSLFVSAERNGIYIMATMMSFDHTKNANTNSANWQKMLASQTNVSTFVNNYIVPFVNRYKTNPYLWSIDVCNEIEWIYENGTGGGDGSNWNGSSYAILQRYVAMCAAGIHNNPRADGSTVLVTVGSASLKWNGANEIQETSAGPGTPSTNSTGNKWNDASLKAQYNQSNAILDFYSPHYYGWMEQYYSSPFENTPAQLGIGEKPCVVGEMPGKSPLASDVTGFPTTTMSLTTAFNNLLAKGWQGHQPWTANLTTGLTAEVGDLATFGSYSVAFYNGNKTLVVPVCTVAGSAPGTAGTIAGANTLCAGQSGSSYSIATVSGATSYKWIVPNGTIITAGSTTPSITLTVGTVGGTITVYPINSVGTGTGSSLTVSVSGLSYSSVGISGWSTPICSGTGVTFTASGVNAGTSPTYTWYKNNVSQSSGTTFTYVPSNGDVIKAVLVTGGTLPVCLSNTSATSTGITLTVTGTSLSSVSITSSATAICSGAGVTFTSTGINGGTAPTYTWKVNGVSQGTGTTFSYVPSNGQTVTAVLAAGGTLPTCLSNTSSTSTGISLTVNPNQTASVSVASSATTLCSGTGVTFTATGVNGGSAPTYTWKVNGTTQSTGTTFSFIPSNGQTVTAVLTAGGTLPTCLTNTTATSTGTTLTVNSSLTASVSIASSATTVCAGTTVVFTATGVNGGTAPSYTWKVNGATQGTGTTFSFVPTNGQTVSAALTAGGTVSACLTNTTATSTGTTLTVNPNQTASVSIASSATTVCAGTNVTFTATGTNPGSTPTYTWYVNGANQGTGSTFSLAPTNGQTVTSVLTAGGTLPTCLTNATATSTGTTLTVNPTQTASVSIATAAASVCTGASVTLTATGTNGGTAPTYTWKVNGTAQGTGTTFTFIPSNGQTVTAVLTVGGTLPTCLTNTTATSTGITFTVNSSLTASVSISSSATTVCAGTSVTFTATGTNGGTAPTYAWKVNGTAQGTGTTFGFVPTNGQTVSAVLTAGGTVSACLTKATATSAGTTLTVNPNQTASVSIASSATTVCAGTNVTFTATGTNPGSTPTYTWYVNGANQGAGSTFSFVPTNGQTVISVLMAGGTLPTCLTNTTATSTGTTLTVNPNQTASVSISTSSLTVCSGTGVALTATGINVGTAPTYSWLVNGTNQGTGTIFSYVPVNGDAVLAMLQVGGNLPSCLSNTTATSNILSLTVSPCLLPQPGSISGLAFVATGSPSVVYSVPTVTGVTYIWTVPNGATVESGQGTNTITVSFGSSTTAGTVGLSETNANGTTKVGLDVTSGTPPNTHTITGPSNVTQNTSNIGYSITTVSGESYQWIVPTGTTLTNGQNTGSVAIDFGSSVSGYVIVVSTNNFGTESDSILVATTAITGLSSSGLLDEVSVYPNPSNGTFNVKIGTNALEATVTITDDKGVTLLSTNSLQDLGSALPSGHYVVTIIYNDKVRHLSFVKLH